ncbi:MAG: hypothetical protein TQ37_01990 [Candidatus Synechococcus spongiarum 15L]|uniref:Pilus assembly protein PilP n=2 Tax=Candidatus Synechococcus spongiarum TaxID=431041 RepID=A0A1T1D093_9SYNE|nr:hypothetical protein [Candidatus Synechococcus spongiarum]KKZ14158.1 MAG: hypothetical protein TQ37_01990 [Candidatus Synechococcus spongiarum 15L]MCY4359690.1 hypothetical protein [Cyanobacteria bacterium MAG APA_bin_95]OOV34292.1 hypothetical protein BV53_06045 [Candidatus Synechococcus spongiarum LMB bulk15N]
MAQRKARRLLLLTGLLPLLAACQGEPPAAGIATRQEAPVAGSLARPDQPVDLSGLTGLPTPDALRQRHTTSRSDPFAALPAVAIAETETSPAEPPGCPLRLTGVTLRNGQPQAFVEGETGAGSLRPGDMGGVSTDVLADGLQVAAIDVPGRQLVLRWSRSQALVTCRLYP